MSKQASDQQTSRLDIVVLIPCHNYGKFLRNSVESVLTHTSLTVLVLIVDDCSTDDTIQVCHSITQDFPNVKSIRNKVNLGHIATYNRALQLAPQSDFIHLLSADDELTPYALDRAVAIMRRHDDVAMVYGRVNMGATAPTGPAPPAVPATYQIVEGWEWIRARCRDGQNPIYSPEVTVRASTAHDVGPYNRNFPSNADLDMWLRIAAEGNVGVITQPPQAFYRLHGSNMHFRHGGEGFMRRRQELADVFRVFFASQKHLNDSSLLLEQLARATIARQTLRTACILFDEGAGEVGLLVDAKKFSVSLSLEVENTGEWTMVTRRLRRGWLERLRHRCLGRLASRVRRSIDWRLRVRGNYYKVRLEQLRSL